MQIIKELVGSKGNQSYNLLSEEERQKLAFLNNSNPYGWGSPRYVLETQSCYICSATQSNYYSCMVVDSLNDWFYVVLRPANIFMRLVVTLPCLAACVGLLVEWR